MFSRITRHALRVHHHDRRAALWDGPTKSIIQTLSQRLQLEVRRLEEFFHGRSADDFCGFEDDVGTGAGVVQGLMVMEGIAQVTGDGVQFMIGQVRPDAAGNLDSAGIGRLGLFQVIRLQQAAQDPRIEDGIVGDQDASFQMRADAVPQGIELRFMGDLVRRDTMNLDIA